MIWGFDKAHKGLNFDLNLCRLNSNFCSLCLNFYRIYTKKICTQALNLSLKFSEILTQGFIGYYPHACGEI